MNGRHKRPNDDSYGWADEQLYMALAHWYLQRKQTAFTTNMPEEKMDRRLADRMQDKRIVRSLSAGLPSYRTGETDRSTSCRSLDTLA